MAKAVEEMNDSDLEIELLTCFGSFPIWVTGIGEGVVERTYVTITNPKKQVYPLTAYYMHLLKESQYQYTEEQINHIKLLCKASFHRLWVPRMTNVLIEQNVQGYDSWDQHSGRTNIISIGNSFQRYFKDSKWLENSGAMLV
jgi:hypothetical protein